VTVYPCGTRPDVSNLNFVAGLTVANSVIAPVSAAGEVCFYVYGTAHLLADVSGYFPAATPTTTPTTPPPTTTPTTTPPPLQVLACDSSGPATAVSYLRFVVGLGGSNNFGGVVVGGVPPYSFSATGLDPGFSFNANGSLTYVSATLGSYTFQVRVADSAGSSVTVGAETEVVPPNSVVVTC